MTRCDLCASPSFDGLLYQLAYGKPQQGAVLESIQQSLLIGWDRDGRVCRPGHAPRALKMFPDARLHWFGHCDHFPQWDVPEETVRLILAATSSEHSTTRLPTEDVDDTNREDRKALLGIGLALTAKQCHHHPC